MAASLSERWVESTGGGEAFVRHANADRKRVQTAGQAEGGVEFVVALVRCMTNPQADLTMEHPYSPWP